MKLLRCLFVSLLLTFSFLIFSHSATPIAYSQNQETVYVGSRHSNKYHYPSCIWAKKIHSENLVTFNGREDARGASYVPCKVCRP